MALIRCSECGNMVSDKAERCPRCGCPVSVSAQAGFSVDSADEETRLIEPPRAPIPGTQPYRKETVAMHNMASKQKQSNNKPLLYAVIALLLLLLAGSAYLIFKDNGSKQTQNQASKQSTATKPKKDTVVVRDTVVQRVEVQKIKEVSPAIAPRPADFRNASYYLTGSIGKYGITMDMDVERGYVSGTYHYNFNKTANRMTFYGNVDEYGVLSMDEYSPDGTNTGVFYGTFDGATARGTFTNLLNGNEFKFTFKVKTAHSN